jgi:hypothetical protein
MAFRPDPLKRPRSTPEAAQTASGHAYEVMGPEDLKQMRTSLSRLSIEAVRQAYHTAHARCRMVNDHVPSARSIQELVQVWRQLWKWR